MRLSLLLLLLCLPATADATVKRLAPGIVFTQEIDKTTPLVVNVVDVDLRSPGVRVGVGIAQDKISGPDPTHGRESVSRYAKRHGTLVAVNADFFPFTGDPLGVGIKDGELFSEPWAGKGSPRVALGLGPDGRTVLLDSVAFAGDLQAADGARFPLSGVNRVPGPGEIVADFPVYGPNAVGRAGGAAVVLSPVSGTVRANTLVVGKAQSVTVNGPLLTPLDPNGGVLCAGPGAGRDFLNLHVHPGDKIGFVVGVAPPGLAGNALQIAAGGLPSRSGVNRAALAWTNITQAVGGGPRLLLNGNVAIDGAAEGFDTSFTNQLNPRTAVGVSRDGQHLIIVTVEGRQAVSKGVTLTDLAALCKRFGAWNAINLDGGGSTTLSVAGLVMGNPNGEGAERPVGDMLTVDSDRAWYTAAQKAPPAPNNGTNIAPPAPNSGGAGLKVSSPADGVGTRLTPPLSGVGGSSASPLSGPGGPAILTVGQTFGLHTPGKSVLWQGMVTGGVGFVTQRGYFLATKPGTGTVTALVDGQYVTQTVTVLPKLLPPTPPSVFALTATLAPDPNPAPNRNAVNIHIANKSGVPLTNTRVTVNVMGGVPDAPFVVTDEDGSASVGVTWSGATGAVTLSGAGAGTVVVVRPAPPPTPSPVLPAPRL